MTTQISMFLNVSREADSTKQDMIYARVCTVKHGPSTFVIKATFCVNNVHLPCFSLSFSHINNILKGANMSYIIFQQRI